MPAKKGSPKAQGQKPIVGRPPKLSDSDFPAIEEMVNEFMSAPEIAECFGIHRDTLCDFILAKTGLNFTAYSMKCRRKKRTTFLEAQYNAAIGYMGPDGKYYPPNPTLNIWFGKNYFWQKDFEPQVDNKVKVVVEIQNAGNQADVSSPPPGAESSPFVSS